MIAEYIMIDFIAAVMAAIFVLARGWSGLDAYHWDIWDAEKY